MKRIVLTSFAILCMLAAVFLMGFRISVKASPELSVHNIDTGLDYATIQEAIDAPETDDGHIIFVGAGVYYENVVVNKQLSLVGENWKTTVIDGNGTGTAVKVATNNVKISGFSIHNSGSLGIHLESSSHNVVDRNAINAEVGICLRYSVQNQIMGNNVTCEHTGIELYYSGGSSVANNYAYGNHIGIRLSDGGNCVVTRNNVTHNHFGFYIENSGNLTLRNNSMTDNRWNFEIHGASLLDYVNDIDVSNTVDGKPIYYWVNQRNKKVPPDAGFVGVVNSTNVTAKNLRLANNSVNLVFAYTSDSIVKNVTTSGANTGLSLFASQNCLVADNKVTDCFEGFGLAQTNNNTICRNTITDSEIGIYIENSYRNTIFGNHIVNNFDGISLHMSSDNRFYHNHIVNNSRDIFDWSWKYDMSPSISAWDAGYPSGGNYWSNYTGVDSDHDGIGDTIHIIDENNQDNYPLMGMFSDFNATSEYHLQIICNSTISHFQFNGTAICFNVTGEDDTNGFCRICIPTVLMNDTYTVFVNGTEVSHTLLPCSNSTHGYLFFTYHHSKQEVVIVPEFPSFLLLPLFIISTLLAATFYRRKHSM